jgi:transcriptional regulator with XRE-family HTH domain
MEDKSRELELNFGNGNTENATAQSVAAGEYANSFLPGSGIEDTPAAYNACYAEVDAGTDSLPGSATENSAMGNDVEALLRSRHPVNRPAGTPPLSSRAADSVSAMETAIAGKSYGTALRLLREQQNMSYKELEQLTLIQPRYLEALENENLDQLPPLVYVIAYIRTLCRLYKLNEETSHKLVSKLKEKLEYSCNDELMNSLDIDRSGAAANEQKLRKIVFAMFGGAATLIVLIVLIIFMATKSDSGKGTEGTVATPAAGENVQKNSSGTFDSNSLYSLLEPPSLDLPKLPVAE